jgi:hypothetical protein
MPKEQLAAWRTAIRTEAHRPAGAGSAANGRLEHAAGEI